MGKSDEQVRVCIYKFEAYKNICMCIEKYQKGYVSNFKLGGVLNGEGMVREKEDFTF